MPGPLPAQTSRPSAATGQKTRQQTLEGLFFRMQSRTESKEASLPPSLTSSSSTIENLAENLDEYEAQTLSGAEPLVQRLVVDEKRGMRVVSGDTLVEVDNNSQERLLRHSVDMLDPNWSLGSMPGDLLDVDQKAKPVVEQAESARTSLADRASAIFKATKSVIGKRRREAVDSSGEIIRNSTNSKRLRLRRQQATSLAPEDPPKKRARYSAMSSDATQTSAQIAASRPTTMKQKKHWLSQGLYVGQERDFDARLSERKNRLKKKQVLEKDGDLDKVQKARSMLPMPMFVGQKIVEIGRPFRLPFDVFSPLPPGQPKPDEWKKTQKNVFIGDAASVWKKAGPLESSVCMCLPESGCDDDCMNRFMLYECDETNCSIGKDSCTNRAFSDLKQRTKAGGKYNVGVEVIKTADRGYGIRANRTFEPNQIITEYTGEIITQEECEHRMRTQYRDAECYYLMDFDQGMILDATRGSIARFVNHSCEPNCRMVKWTVQGKPRMALFSGDKGIMTGEELTYDYNFNPYSVKNVQECRCGAEGCRGVLGPKPKEIKEALNPIIGGGKRKLQALVEDTMDGVLDAVAAKKRKFHVSKGVKDVLSTVKPKEKPKPKGKPLPKGWVYPIEAPEFRAVNEVDPEAIIRAKRRAAKSSASPAANKDGQSRSISGVTLTNSQSSEVQNEGLLKRTSTKADLA